MVNVTDVVNETAEILSNTGINPQAANGAVSNSIWGTASVLLAGFLNAVSERIWGKAVGITPELASWLLLAISAFFLFRNLTRIARLIEQWGYLVIGGIILVLALIFVGVKF